MQTPHIGKYTVTQENNTFSWIIFMIWTFNVTNLTFYKHCRTYIYYVIDVLFAQGKVKFDIQ